MEPVRSKNGVLIRLTEERWVHITEEHCELAGYVFEVLETVADPEAVYEGGGGELLAVRKVEQDRSLVVVYKEVTQADGFIITAFLTTKVRQLEKRTRRWPPN